ncbi:MAG: hypothetical protein IKT99_03685, partial [Oscillospiraceae bacterium]|nr:hypothetical protein [Oscillospiraceae bacterium]
MKKVSKTLAIVLCLVMILSLTAMASWYTYGKDNTHNHVVTSAPTSSAPPITEVALLNAGGGWDGMDTEPIMKTVGTGTSAETYAFVLYDGHAAGATLGRIKCSDGSLVNSNVSSATGFQLSTPVLVEPTTANGLTQDAIFVASAASTEKLAVLTDSSWAFSSTAGTPTSTSLPTTGNNLVTLTQTGVSMDTSHTYRLYLGIWVGTSSSITGSVTVTTKINGVTATVLNNETSQTGTSVILSGTPMEDEENPGNYYYYYNVNLLNLNNYSLTSSNSVSFEVNITSGNSGGTFEIRKPSMLSNKGSIKKFTDLYGDRPVADGSFQPKVNGVDLEINQQINTPITTDGTYLYFGTWGGANTAGSYYQVKISDGVTRVFTPSNYGFYWAGAYTDGTRVYFGSDNGMLYWRSVAYFNTMGGSLNLATATGGASDVGNIRSTVMQDSNKLYFTSQGGYLWCCSFSSNKLVID